MSDRLKPEDLAHERFALELMLKASDCLGGYWRFIWQGAS